MKLRKQRKRKVYRYKINRKRLRNKIFGVGKPACKEVKEAWEKSKSVKTNLREMGLSYDPNETIGIPNCKKDYREKLLSEDKLWKEEKIDEKPEPTKGYVAQELENEARAPREKLFRLPKSQIESITYLLDKYGTDYKAMSKDKRNYYQETWKQIRAKVRMFKKIPEQYNKYLEERGLSDSDLTEIPFDEDDD